MIIDFRFSAPTPEGLLEYVTPPEHHLGYAAVYGKRVYGGSNPDVHEMNPDELLQYLDRFGIDKALLKSGDTESTQGSKYPMDRLASWIGPHSDRLIGTAGVDPHKGIRAVRELQWAIQDLGFKAAQFSPIAQKLPANDRRYYPFYAKCVELGVPALLHSSIHFDPKLTLDLAHPKYIDSVAIDFPELKIVCVHGGWPWVTEMIAVAWRHPNVHIEISGVRPKYIAMPGTGWEPLITYGRSQLQDRIVWGSNWPQVLPDEGIDGVRLFGLKPEVELKWLGGNAARVLGLPIEPTTVPA